MYAIVQSGVCRGTDKSLESPYASRRAFSPSRRAFPPSRSALATVLCIDDNRNVLELHKSLLESNGYRVLIALDGPTGIALTRKHSIDAMVLDFNMPGMDGNEVAAVMTKQQPKLPIVICSGYIDEIPESLRWFADALLQKADAPGALLSVVERLVKAKAGDISKKGSAGRGSDARERLSA